MKRGAGCRRLHSRSVVVILAVLISFTSIAACGRQRDSGVAAPTATPTVAPTVFCGAAPIWIAEDVPERPMVGLFVHEFTISETTGNAQLNIFADTRYEAWLDGGWIGRGPARFSSTRHEYDVLALGQLAPGAHSVSVIVQWAPNYRRSESTRPHLIAEVRIDSGGEEKVVAATGSLWRTAQSPHWASNAEQVHEWGLLGPTEVQAGDGLRSYAYAEAFDVTMWDWAVEVTLDPLPLYAERSIPALANVEMLFAVLDAGLLSPGKEIVQLKPNGELRLYATSDEPLILEIPVDAHTGESITAHIDGIELAWKPVGASRPDVVQHEIESTSDAWDIEFYGIPEYGLPVAYGPKGTLTSPQGLTQGVHAGRRLLLAEPITTPGAVHVEAAADGLSADVEFVAGPAYIVLDLGRVVHGRIVAEASGPGGAIVDVGWDERLYMENAHTQAGRPLPHPGTRHPEWNQVDSWRLAGEQVHMSTLDARAGRYVLIAAWSAGVRLDNLRIVEERYPVDLRGRFESSNMRLNAIWQLGVNTAYSNMQDAYVDAWRERGQWWGDAYVADHINQVAFGDSLLLKRGLRAIADEADADGNLPAYAPNSDSSRLLDYGMLWVQSLQDYVERTADVAFAEEMFGPLQDFVRYVETLRREDTGLINMPAGHWSESALVDWAGDLSRHGQSTVLNALYVQTLRDGAYIATQTGDHETAARWCARADAIADAVNRELYIPEQGRYASSILDGEIVKPTTHAQAWPLAFRIVPDSNVDSVAKSALDPFWTEIFGMYWVLEGLGRAGHIEAAVELIEAHYGPMLDKGATTLWEHWNSDERYNAALSHAWGGSPTWFLSTYVLGVRQTGPMTYEVRPALAGVDWASGSLPLAQGEVEVSWRKQAEGDWLIKVKGSEGSVGVLLIGDEEVPIAGGEEVKLFHNQGN